MPLRPAQRCLHDAVCTDLRRKRRPCRGSGGRLTSRDRLGLSGRLSGTRPPARPGPWPSARPAGSIGAGLPGRTGRPGRLVGKGRHGGAGARTHARSSSRVRGPCRDSRAPDVSRGACPEALWAQRRPPARLHRRAVAGGRSASGGRGAPGRSARLRPRGLPGPGGARSGSSGEDPVRRRRGGVLGACTGWTSIRAANGRPPARLGDPARSRAQRRTKRPVAVVVVAAAHSQDRVALRTWI